MFRKALKVCMCDAIYISLFGTLKKNYMLALINFISSIGST